MNLSRDFGLGDASEFVGTVVWRFKRKHQIKIDVVPYSNSKSHILDRTITINGNTYQAGASITTNVDALFIYPRYQWNFIMRKRGHLGIYGGVNMFSLNTKIKGAWPKSQLQMEV